MYCYGNQGLMKAFQTFRQILLFEFLEKASGQHITSMAGDGSMTKILRACHISKKNVYEKEYNDLGSCLLFERYRLIASFCISIQIIPCPICLSSFATKHTSNYVIREKDVLRSLQDFFFCCVKSCLSMRLLGVASEFSLIINIT